MSGSSARDSFLNYVRNGSGKPFVSLQIGAGAGFDAKLAGKEYCSEATVQDTIAAYEKVGGAPLFNFGIPAHFLRIPELQWATESSMEDSKKITKQHLETPHGELRWEFHELPRHGGTPVKYPLTLGDGLDAVEWYAEQFSRCIQYIPDAVRELAEEVKPHGPLSVQWNIQPFELFGLMAVNDLVMNAMMDMDRYRQVCNTIRDINIEASVAAIQGGADFVFLGSPGAELMSPALYEEFIIPDSQAITKAIHEAGGLIYSHICSPVEPFLSMGFFNQMGLDLFETLSPPPVGNVQDLREARSIIDSPICTRGNIGLDVLLQGTVEDVRKATLDVLEATSGTKHMVAASDYLFYDIPLENAQAVIQAVENK